jgi:phosphoribosylaminoimidazole-succinocarboxamide synthase
MQPATSCYEGKAKRVLPHSATEVALQYKDDATAFNGRKHAVFAGKGDLNSHISERLFEHLERLGVPTHHLGRLDSRTLLAQRADMFPLEVVVRFKVSGSLGTRTGLAEETRCEPPVTEVYYKRDDLGDPLLNDDHIRLLGVARADEVDGLRAMALDAAEKLRHLFAEAGIDLIDLKFEFGKTARGVVLADEISPDTCRLRDAKTGTLLDKDRFRKDKGDLLEGYRELARRLDAVLDQDGHV